MKSNIGNTKDKVTIVQEEKYLTYGTVLCFFPLTDLLTRRAGLSASAELLLLLSRVSILSRVIDIKFVCLSDSLSDRP